MIEKLRLLLYIERHWKDGASAINISWSYRPKFYIDGIHYFIHDLDCKRHRFVTHRTDGPAYTSYSHIWDHTTYYKYSNGNFVDCEIHEKNNIH